MKNLINYYYNILIDNYKKIDNIYSFISDSVKYIFIDYDGNIEKIYKLYLIVSKRKYCHKILINKDGNIITPYNNKGYVLIKEVFNSNKILDINDIVEYTFPVYEKDYINWKELWMKKIDYYEYQISQFSKNYSKLSESFSYYSGLCENAISLLNNVDFSKINLYICHKRIYINETLDEFYNPLGFYIDSRVRDVAEYIKINYINERIDLNYVINIINNINFNYNEIILFLSRLLYPSYYFDMYDLIIQEKINEKEIIKYIKKNTYYEVFLRNIYKYIKTLYKIPIIEWLE